MPQVEYFDRSEWADFDERHRARAIRLLREATRHVERWTLRQAIAEAAARQQVKDASGGSTMTATATRQAPAGVAKGGPIRRSLY